MKKIFKTIQLLIIISIFTACPISTTGTSTNDSPTKNTPPGVKVQPTEFTYKPYSGPKFVPHSGVWTAPVGIPNPSFGITEKVTDFKNKKYDYGSGMVDYKLNSNGEPYTHYIDNSHVNATDKDNQFGTEDKPRKTLKTSGYLPGSIIEVHGGPYSLGGAKRFEAYGTIDKPIYLRGSLADRPEFSGAWYLAGSYFIIENIHFNSGKVTPRLFDRDSFSRESVEYISIRDNEFSNINNSIIGMWSEIPAKPINNIVIFNNFIHSDYFNPENGFPREKDSHGISSGNNVRDVWIVDNQISNMTGDAIQIGHALKHTAYNFYIGRNRLFTCGENAIDTKETKNIVVSENIMYNFKAWNKIFDPEKNVGGTAVVIHYGPELSTENIWLIKNEIYDCEASGIQIGGDQLFDVYMVGNTIRDIKNDRGSAKAIVTWNSRSNYVINNLIYNSDIGLSALFDGTGDIQAYNNIISEINVDNGHHTFVQGLKQISGSKFNNNLFYQTNSDNISARIRNSEFKFSASEFNLEVTGDNNIFSDPGFINASNNNFTVPFDSIVFNKAYSGTNISELKNIYKNSFGLDLDLLNSKNIGPY